MAFRALVERTYTASPEEIQLAELASNVYNFSAPDPACWTRIVNETFNAREHDGDNVALYKCVCKDCMSPPTTSGISTVDDVVKSPTAVGLLASGTPAVRDQEAVACALAFSGTDDITDAMTDLKALVTGKFCGFEGWHRGFAEGLADLVDSRQWRPFDEALAKCTRLIVLGHSLGGAYATIAAHCVNCAKQQDCYRPRGLDAVKAEAELYTWGAPALLSKVPLNGQATDGVFKGKRFWNFDPDKRAVDMVPYIAQKVGYFHPKVLTVGLGPTEEEVRVTDATDPAAPVEPAWADLFDFLNAWWSRKISQHFIAEYGARMRMHLAAVKS